MAQKFWKIITFQTSKVVALPVPCTSDVILLDLWKGSEITGHTRDLLSLLFLAAKCVWAKHWKAQRIPSVKEWIIKVWDLAIEDKLSECILRSENPDFSSSFVERWSAFLGYAG